MPKYDYVCDNCNHEIVDIYQSIHDEAITKCPSCSQESLRRVIYGGLGSFMKDAKTIGSLAEKNWSNKGHYEKSEIEAKSNKPKDQSMTSKINNMTSEQKTKYIMTGET